jgi:tetratricopeptide (TPR) repeat protein
MNKIVRPLSFAFILAVLCLPLAAQTAAAKPGALALQNYRLGRQAESQYGLGSQANAYYNKVIAQVQSEIQASTANLDSYTAITWALNRQAKYQDVVTYGSQGLKLGVDYRIIETMGEAYFYLKNYNSSLRYMERYVGAVPKGDRSSVAFFFIGEIYRIQDKPHHADIAYTTAVTIDPSSALWWYRLGTVREELGDKVPAIQAYQHTLQISPGFRDTQTRLSKLQ